MNFVQQTSSLFRVCRIGRKSTLIVSMILSCLMGLARSFAWSYEIFLLFEFLDPALGTGIYTSALVLGSYQHHL